MHRGNRRPNRQSRGGNVNTHNTRDPSQASSSSTSTSHFRPHPRPRPQYTPVPKYSSITPGTPVSIVLKQDQPTGRQVQGTVSEVLTRGDHPRGVKVRLNDGRVGRVQRLASADEMGGAEGGETFETDEREDVGESAGNGVRGRGGGRGRARGRGRGRGGGGYTHVQDVRNDEYVYDENSRGRDLGAYFDAAFERLGISENVGRSGEGKKEGDAATASCPVCHVFEGDERAVSWHVENVHFGGE